jgi:murein DD-endopeptidase MepM/ murein hydrolase activator NlpD
MRIRKVHPENFLASLLSLVIDGSAVSSCTATRLRAVAPSNTPPDVSGRWPADDALPHQGISIGGRRYFGHEIVAPSEGVVVRIRGDHVTIHHGLESNSQDIYTEHFHVHGASLKEGDRVIRGQSIGLIGPGRYTALPHYHYVVRKREGQRKFIVLDPTEYWFGIDQYKEKLGKALDTGPFVIPCFDPNVSSVSCETPIREPRLSQPIFFHEP